MPKKKKQKEIDKNENKIYLNANINEVFASTELTQYFQNPLDNPIELQIRFPIKEKINLSKFEISTNSKKIVSKVLSKEKANEKYSDAIAQGNTAIKSDYSKSFKSYNINIGNLGPKESICLKTYYNQSIFSYDMSYQYIIMKDFPSFDFENQEDVESDDDIDEDNEEGKKVISPEIIINININTFSKITRLITNLKEKEKLTISYNKDYTEANIKNNITNKNIKKNYSIDLHILFRTKDINKPQIFYQYNPNLKNHSYSLNYLYSSNELEKLIKVPKKPDEDDTISYFSKYQSDLINEEPALFIFLVDQSGSMYGSPIELVRNSLLLFIQSLPKESYFQIIGFGSDFIKYNENPVKYNKQNVNKIKERIKNIEGDMGGTNIIKPLKDIFDNKNEYQKINLGKNILLLTDGEVENKDECFDLIKENSDFFRIHSIGCGDDFDKELIQLCGKYGKGSSNYVKDMSNINNTIINILNNCLRPYLYDIKITFLNINKENNNLLFIKNDNFVYQDEIINYSFILENSQKNSYLKDNIFKFKIEFIKNNVKFEKYIELKSIMKLPEGDNMTKIIIDKFLKNNSDLDEKKEIELSKKYEVLSKNTSLFAEICNEKSQKNQLIQVNILSKVKSNENFNLNHLGYFPRRQVGNKAARKSCPVFYGYRIAHRRLSDSFETKKNLGKKRKKSSQKDESEEEENELDDEEIESEEEEKEIDLLKLITSQDPIDGFWSKNKETIKVEKILPKNIIKNVNKICLKMKEKEKIFYTILILYYISTNYKNKIGEYK